MFDFSPDAEKIAVIGLGYVGFPVAIALARKFSGVTGFDTNPLRLAALREGHDWTNEVSPGDIAAAPLRLSGEAADLKGSTFFIVTVPTPIDQARRPDFGPLRAACATIAPRLAPGSVVVFESTVYPGATEDICGQLLEEGSGLTRGRDFFLGYSPERINPGDAAHPLEKITKIVSAESPESLARVKAVYGSIIDAGLYEAPSIKVAEAAKVIENTQRDVNIALMNELALICDRLGIRTADVLAAAGTKWNFLPFSPGLVGGHCIGVDPYYLTAKAEETGYHPEVILSGRRVNDSMGRFIAGRTMRFLSQLRVNPHRARVGMLGLTFKENVPDLRNSKAFDIIEELRTYGIDPLVNDPMANPGDANLSNDIRWTSLEAMKPLDALILAVPHRTYLQNWGERLQGLVRKGGAILDVRSVLDPSCITGNRLYWSL
jgi:UDP-N-acetyl-D-galactosamine dehydrogenase